MFNRFPPLTTLEEDFRALGLIKESDDASKPREVPSPDPSTLSGLDDSEGDKKSHTASAKQPKPKLGPDADDAAKSGYDPEEDGGSKGVGKGGGSGRVAGGKEAGLKGESKANYQKGKEVHPKGKGKNKGQKPAVAQGLKPVKKHAGMKAEGRLGKAAALIEDVNALLLGAQISEEVDGIMRGFALVAENASLLSDRYTEISDRYEVDAEIAKLESLAKDAVEALSVVEDQIELGLVGDDEEENQAIAHSAAVAEEDVEDLDEEDEKVKSDRDPDKEYDVPSPAFKEHAERLFKAMVSEFMDSLGNYDAALDDMGADAGADLDMGAGDPADADNMDTFEGQDDPDCDTDDGDDQDDSGGDGEQPAGDDDAGDDDGGDDLMSKMRNLRGKKDAMKGGGGKAPPFRGND